LQNYGFTLVQKGKGSHLTPLALSGAIKSTAILALGRATLQDICPQVKITQSKKLLFQSVVCEGHREQNGDYITALCFL
jgi:hypothetical protein